MERITLDGWWPTKGIAPLNAFAGESACGKCHFQKVSAQRSTPMAEAAFRVSDGARPREPVGASFQSGAYAYQLIEEKPGLRLTVSSGSQSISSKITWIFGAGVHGQTYMLENDGTFNESQVSSFSATRGMDITPGHTQAGEGNLRNALGERLSTAKAARCFACHATASSTDSKFNPATAVPGIHCEACHGPGMDHITAIEAGQMDKARKAILNPAQLPPVDSVAFCGACHRTSMDVVEARAYGPINVRFQPYRLEKSRCWGTTGDARLTCIACHNPHEPLVRNASFYDQRCLACHGSRADGRHEPNPSASARGVCPEATANCAGCHMPRYDAPGMHAKFTDHFIRIVRPVESYPN